jgi:hypothetical protein
MDLRRKGSNDVYWNVVSLDAIKKIGLTETATNLQVTLMEGTSSS